MAAIKNLTIDQGSTFGAVVKIYDVNNSAYDLTNHTASSQIRKAYTSASPSATFTCSIPTPTTGDVYLALTDEQTSVLKAGRYVYDVYVEDNIGQRYRAIEGMVTVTPAVTKV